MTTPRGSTGLAPAYDGNLNAQVPQTPSTSRTFEHRKCPIPVGDFRLGLLIRNGLPTCTARGIGRTLVYFSSVRNFEPHPTSRFQAVSI